MLYFSGKGCSEFPKKVLILIGILNRWADDLTFTCMLTLRKGQFRVPDPNASNYVQKITVPFILRVSMISSNSLVCSLEAELIQYQIAYVPTDTCL